MPQLPAVGLPARAGPQPSHLSLLTAARGLSGIYTTAASCWTAIYPFSQLLEDYQVYTTAASCWTAIYPFSQLLEDYQVYIPQPLHLPLLTAARGLSGICPSCQLLDSHLPLLTAARGLSGICHSCQLLDCLLELGHSPHIYPFSQLLEDYQVYILQLPAVGQPSTPSHSCWRTIRYIPQLPAVGQPSTPSHSC